MNIQLLCTTLLLCVQYLSAAPSIVPSLVPAVVPSIVPADEECDDVRCPELDCTNVIKNEGECCDSCITVDGCLHDGELYEELSMVPLNRSDPCEACFCYNGNITCENISGSCPQLKCNTTQHINEPEKCCPRCFNGNPVAAAGAVCEEHGITYKENDTWNPFYVNFGTVKSLNCTCKNGTSICKRSSEEEACKKTINDSSVTTNCSTSTFELDPDSPSENNSTCTSVHTHKVYEAVEEYPDQVAIENVTSSRVHVFVWLPKLPSGYVEAYNSTYFAKTFINTRFKFIANTTDELVKTIHDWLQIEDKKQNLYYCRANCSTQVINLLLQPCN